jgi:hypothetical protein
LHRIRKRRTKIILGRGMHRIRMRTGVTEAINFTKKNDSPARKSTPHGINDSRLPLRGTTLPTTI